MDKCNKCGEPVDWIDGYCIDCWPGYNLCKACDDYRCEHVTPAPEDLLDPEFTSCHCGNIECRAGFVEGSTNRIVNKKEFAEIRKSWEGGENRQ